MKIEPNAQYNLVIDDLIKNRDCIMGAAQIRRQGYKYLVHPSIGLSPVDGDFSRYKAYSHGAEFHEYPGETLSALIGKLSFGDAEVELPESLEYLTQNADGDGMSLEGLMEYAASNILQAKYHILLAELPNSAEIDSRNLSVAEARRLNIKSCIKQYSRESLIDWQFSMYDKVKQLTLLVFCETETERNEDYSISQHKAYLVCGLDDGGYYQMRFRDTDTGSIDVDRQKIYPTIAGQRLRWIPCEIVSDEEMPSGALPISTGYLSAICDAALARYRVSADYKEALRNGVPTLFTKGWTDGDGDLFKVINGGRENVVTGSGVVNNLPNNVSVMVEGVALNDAPFMNYMEANAKLARSLGAKFSDTESSSVATATEASINAGNNNAMLERLCDNLEAAFTRVILYCGMFNGLWGQDGIESNLDSIQIRMKRDFSAVTMTPQEALAVRDLYISKLISLETAVGKLVQGGFTPIDAETELARIESEAPLPNLSLRTIDNQESNV